MNLNKLFKTQKKLDERILERFPDLQDVDLLDKKILALLVELGELAQNWRGFKFWSEDQEPITKKLVENTNEYGVVFSSYYKNPLLEEYCDCLHFILSIGNDIKINAKQAFLPSGTKQIITLFAKINRYVSELWWQCHDNGEEKTVKWLFAFSNLLRLGEQLGFTWKQIEQAYYHKNETNHKRQENGY